VPPTSDPDPAPPAGALALLDRASGAARAAAHACASPLAREHLEYALALLAESWIAESGQQARTPARLLADVRATLGLFAALAGRDPVTKPDAPREARLHQQPITSNQ
jgi:hypothetical protein